MTHRVIALVVLATILLPSSTVRAMDLLEAMERAAGDTEAAALLDNSVRRALAAEEQAFGRLLPTLSASTTLTRNNDEILVGDRVFVNLYDYSGNVNLAVPLFDGTLYPARRAAQQSVEAVEMDRVWQRALLRRAAARAYMAVLTAIADHEAAQDTLELARTNIEQARALNELGYGLPTDVSQAELALLEAENTVLSARIIRDDALAQLAFLVGETELAADQIEAVTLSATTSVSGAALANVEALRLEALALDTAIDAENWNYAPRANFQANYNLGRSSLRAPNGTFWTMSVTFSWTIFDHTRRANRELARAALESSEYDRGQVERQNELDRTNAARRVEQAGAQLALADQTVQVATATRDLVAEQYELGATTLLALREADDALFRARANQNRARLELDLAFLEAAFFEGTFEEPEALRDWLEGAL